MPAKHPATELARHLNWLYDQIRGQLGTFPFDAEAAEAARREICVIFECLADEVMLVKKQSQARDREALYGVSASGRFLAALGVPPDHRAWRRLDSVEQRARESKTGEVRVIL